MDRTKYIGGSDIAKLCGVSPYGNEATVWLEKTGKHQTSVDNRFTEWGKRLEKTIAQAFYDNHPEFSRVGENIGLKHDKYDFIGGEADSVYHNHEGKGGVLEIKTASQYNDKEWEDGKCPDHYALQVQWYLMLAGYTEAYLVVLIGGSDYRELKIVANPELQNNMLSIACNFWFNYVVPNVMPPITEADDKTLKLLYPSEVANKMIVIKDRKNFCMCLKDLKLQKKEIEKQIEQAEGMVKAALGDAEIGVIDNLYVAEWKTIQMAAYEVKATEYRKLTIKPITKYKGLLPEGVENGK